MFITLGYPDVLLPFSEERKKRIKLTTLLSAQCTNKLKRKGEDVKNLSTYNV
jgi:hypothetical protein